MGKYRKIGNDYYLKIGSLNHGKVYDGAGRCIGEIGEPQKIERNVETEIKGKRDTFKIVNDKVFDSKNKLIGNVSRFTSLIDGNVHRSEVADVVAFIALINQR